MTPYYEQQIKEVMEAAKQFYKDQRPEDIPVVKVEFVVEVWSCFGSIKLLLYLLLLKSSVDYVKDRAYYQGMGPRPYCHR